MDNRTLPGSGRTAVWMNMTQTPDSEKHQSLKLNQQQVLRAYTVLCAVADRTLGGKLVVFAGLGQQGAALALASTLAGAACLCIDAQPQRIKNALRQDCCDFMVNHLDEALRILKNQIRKRKPVSVGLLGNAAEVLPEMAERGVLPDLLADLTPLGREGYLAPGGMDIPAAQAAHLEALRQLQQMGALVLDFDGSESPTKALRAEDLLAKWAVDHVVQQTRWTAQTPGLQGMKQFDELALAQLPEEDRMRRRWLEQAPKYFRREVPQQRVLWMSPGEKQLLEAALAQTEIQVKAD
ncbi:MAG: hypothetical protein ACYC46_06165 [Acidobacteriaceae bacterium]